MAEIKQFLRPDGLWTQQGENSHRPLISLNLKRYINPGKSKITEWITPVRDTAGNIEAICVGSSMFQLRKQERMWTSCSALAKWSPVFQVNLHNTGSKTTHISFKYTSLWNAYWTRKKGWPHRNHIYLTSGRLFHYFLFFMLFSHQQAKQAPRFASSAALSSTWSPVHCTWNEKHHVVIIDGRFKEILTWRKLEYVLNVLFYSHFVTPVTRHIW